MSQQPRALLDLSGTLLYSEHGFIVVTGASSDDEGFWNAPSGPGVTTGPDWVRIGGGVAGVFVDLNLTVLPGTGPHPQPGSATLRLHEDTLTITDPVSSFGVTWPMPTGLYLVTATITDLPGVSPEPSAGLPMQSWQVDLTAWPD